MTLDSVDYFVKDYGNFSLGIVIFIGVLYFVIKKFVYFGREVGMTEGIEAVLKVVYDVGGVNEKKIKEYRGRMAVAFAEDEELSEAKEIIEEIIQPTAKIPLQRLGLSEFDDNQPILSEQNE